jgi:hypothetical protein
MSSSPIILALHLGEGLDEIGKLDGQIAETSPGKLRALPSDGGKIGRGREQMFHDRRAPFIAEVAPGFRFREAAGSFRRLRLRRFAKASGRLSPVSIAKAGPSERCRLRTRLAT